VLTQIGVCVLLLVATTAIHASAMVLAFDVMKLTQVSRWARCSVLTRLTLVSSLVVLMFLASVLEAALWALTYLALDALPSFEAALYFSMVTFTTLGYGDVTLDEKWRLLSSFSAVNGLILFGWTTALILAVVQRVYLGSSGGRPADPA